MKTPSGADPWSARVSLVRSLALDHIYSQPTWASAADQGVRPTLETSPREGSAVKGSKVIVRITGRLGSAFDNCAWLQGVKVNALRAAGAGILHASRLM